ncbi:Zn-dependent hydrolase [Actinoplanes lobatus]|uniref:N-carbamoyl-L-amino-acid hydrolase n=1 Tax=Actinoplanes lobatus TaxID=113568 RepID=A0A7W7HE15_9ACTN|nr:allantoate amidohydrolase [Actinoplanes lobatus]MBB4748809.1 N-carbamoyl-L-amino-acid hydrolase [Actinoplanes lobatus]GGN67490.1 Zn-dependent hydrolase [Actinoplanes lobatus]GIE37282.1 Zn-dependent hydrolase [Actinoplanes lobatus]
MSEFGKLWAEIAPVGRAAGGGYLRYALTAPELTLRDWFRGQAAQRDMTVTEDGNGNLFAWRAEPWAPGTVLTGSHFDSVPHGGGYDGPLGIVSAFLAVDELPRDRKVVVAAFAEEEGGRFGVPCLGSRLLTGAIAPEKAAALRDRDGVTFAEALGRQPAGADPRVRTLSAVVELHIEQGRALTVPVGVASAIWPHGRWRMDFTGVGDHAGTTLMADRRDPMQTFAFTVLVADREARLAGAHATMGRVQVEPNATNAIPSLVRGWLDARAADTGTLDQLVGSVVREATERASRDGTGVEVTAESVTGEVAFDNALAVRLSDLLGGAPILPTGAGHDAGVLSAHVPTAMLFVRNPTGVSHSPAEHASDADCEAGVEALARVLEALT